VAVAVESVANSFRESFSNWFILSGDLIVAAEGTEGGWLESPLRREVGEELRNIPGVARVETYRAVQGQQFGETRIAMVAVSPGFIDTPQFRNAIVAGDAEGAIRAITIGDEVLISDSIARRSALGPGDSITLPTPVGPETFRIHSVITGDFSGDQGSVIINRDRFVKFWGDSRVSRFNLFLSSDADRGLVRSEIDDRLGDDYRIKVYTLDKALRYHKRMINGAFTFTYAIQLLVIAVTLAGITDLLLTQIIERRREIGLLRVVGAGDPAIARSIWVEALIIGLAGALLGVGVSIGTSLLWVHVNFPLLIGYVMEHHFAFLTALLCVGLAGGVALVAGVLAARQGLRQPVLDAIRYE
jgi:putative ABC transport system permease protein